MQNYLVYAAIGIIAAYVLFKIAKGLITKLIVIILAILGIYLYYKYVK